MIKEKTKNCVKTILAVSGFALLAGCSSMAEFAADARASYDKGRYEAFSKAAMEDTENYCLEKFKDQTDLVKENPDLIKDCINNDYEKRLNYYLTHSANTNNKKPVTSGQPATGQKVYKADECIGAIVNGVCHGSILPKSGHQKTCHGTMINGQCTGPMF